MAELTHYSNPQSRGIRTQMLLDVILATELSWYQMIGLYPEGLDIYDEHLALIQPKLKFPG